ncbi:hypothetical protein C1645_839785 [Glomus cerebriforme]|uniref:Uncharacterized protein n=1 Tax=Glomus cerebriforme TaxID=658196 RepID=A0A397S041_9GLOM|nr:hypothetical protein C1645_839785 [Glomus cerebriforme]
MTKPFPPEIVYSIILYLKQPFHLLYTCNKTKLSFSSQSTNPEFIYYCHCSKEKRQSQAANLLMTYYSIKYYDDLVKEEIIDTKKLKLLSFDTKFNLRKTNNNNPCSCLDEENWNYDSYLDELMDEFTELNFPETKQCFANLTELVFTARERKDEIFSLLSQTCHNI